MKKKLNQSIDQSIDQWRQTLSAWQIKSTPSINQRIADMSLLTSAFSRGGIGKKQSSVIDILDNRKLQLLNNGIDIRRLQNRRIDGARRAFRDGQANIHFDSRAFIPFWLDFDLDRRRHFMTSVREREVNIVIRGLCVVVNIREEAFKHVLKSKNKMWKNAKAKNQINSNQSSNQRFENCTWYVNLSPGSRRLPSCGFCAGSAFMRTSPVKGRITLLDLSKNFTAVKTI